MFVMSTGLRTGLQIFICFACIRSLIQLPAGKVMVY